MTKIEYFQMYTDCACEKKKSYLSCHNYSMILVNYYYIYLYKNEE
jgi:hypothetical protein